MSALQLNDVAEHDALVKAAQQRALLQPEGHCGRCKRFALRPIDKLAAHSFGRCALIPEWRYRNVASTCVFNPSRFEDAIP